jgi:hypothetical protein
MKPMSFEIRAAFRNEISVLDPEISRFCADFGYARDPSCGTFPGFRLFGPREPKPGIEIEFAADKFAGERYVFTPDLLFSIWSGTQWREERYVYRHEGAFCMTYVQFAVIRRHIGAILRKAHSSLIGLTVADVISQGVKFNSDVFKQPPFPELPFMRGPLANRVVSEAELERYLGS